MLKRIFTIGLFLIALTITVFATTNVPVNATSTAFQVEATQSPPGEVVDQYLLRNHTEMVEIQLETKYLVENVSTTKISMNEYYMREEAFRDIVCRPVGLNSYLQRNEQTTRYRLEQNQFLTSRKFIKQNLYASLNTQFRS
jgi:hypothetical protein